MVLATNGNAITPTTAYDESIQSRVTDTPTMKMYPQSAGFWLYLQTMDHEIPDWSYWPWWRDRHLRMIARSEAILAGTLAAFSYKIETTPHKINAKGKDLDMAEALWASAEYGKGGARMNARLIYEANTQDNGFFVEKYGAGEPDGELLECHGVAMLDSGQVMRTFDPDTPIYYTNPVTGKVHEVNYSRVYMGSQLEQPYELGRGVGFCAVSRALRAVRIMRDIQIYKDEKISGRFTRGIISGKGATTQQFEAVTRGSDHEMEAMGYTTYKGLPVLISVDGVELNLLDLASLPDGFDTEKDTTLYVYALATAFGIDAREIWPATSSGATKADATVQHMKAQGKGFGWAFSTLEQVWDDIFLSAGLEATLEYDVQDDAADQAQAQIHQTKIQNAKEMKAEGALDKREMRAYLIHEKVLTRDFLENVDEYDDLLPDDFEEDATPEALQQPAVRTPDNPTTLQEVIPSEEDVRALWEGMTQGIPTDQRSQSEYQRNIRALVRSLWRNESSPYLFINNGADVIRRGFTQAWEEGAAREGITPDEFTTEESQRLQALIAEEIGFLPGFADSIVTNDRVMGGRLTDHFNRAALWVSRYARVAAIAQLYAGKNKKKRWVYHPEKEHCEDCRNYNGRVYRASTWLKYNIQPKSPLLACFGGHCGCEFENTDERCLPGRPPAPKGPR